MSRGSSWSDAEVTALISIWGDAHIQEQLDGATRNRIVIELVCLPAIACYTIIIFDFLVVLF